MHYHIAGSIQYSFSVQKPVIGKYMVTVFFLPAVFRIIDVRIIDVLLNSPVKKVLRNEHFQTYIASSPLVLTKAYYFLEPIHTVPLQFPSVWVRNADSRTVLFSSSARSKAQCTSYLSFHMFIKTRWLDPSTSSTNIVGATRGTFWLLRSKQT
jgi:hypothetical protein